jgi:hypothetical protein
MEFLESHFDYDITYKPGKSNPADPLSRLKTTINAVSVVEPSPILSHLFDYDYDQDPSWKTWTEEKYRDGNLWRNVE